jgi:hypothetical protein
MERLAVALGVDIIDLLGPVDCPAGPDAARTRLPQ